MDADDLVQKDAEKARNAYKKYQQGGSLTPGAEVLLEQIMFSMALLSLIGMIVLLPWVGSDRLIPGEIWIGAGTGGILLFGFLGWLVRVVRNSFGEVDKTVTQKFSRR